MDKPIRDLLIELLSNLSGDESQDELTGLRGLESASTEELSWIVERLDRPVQADPILLRSESRSHRVLHPSEQYLFEVEAVGLLHELGAAGVVSSTVVEELIDYARMVSTAPIGKRRLLDILPSFISDIGRTRLAFRGLSRQASTHH